MKILTWNLEWSPSCSELTARIQARIAATNPDVVCYTEVLRHTLPDHHLAEADPDYGYAHPGDRRKVRPRQSVACV